MLVQLKNVFALKILPEVFKRSMMNYDTQNRKYCACVRPSFEPIITCGSSKCQF